MTARPLSPPPGALCTRLPHNKHHTAIWFAPHTGLCLPRSPRAKLPLDRSSNGPGFAVCRCHMHRTQSLEARTGPELGTQQVSCHPCGHENWACPSAGNSSQQAELNTTDVSRPAATVAANHFFQQFASQPGPNGSLLFAGPTCVSLPHTDTFN